MDTQELKQTVEDYVDMENPGYGIMISGPWGCGKTHLIKNILEGCDTDSIYISLFGAQSLDDIKDKVFVALTSLESVSEKDIKKASNFLGSCVKAFSDIGDSASAIGAIASTVGATLKERMLSGLKNVTIIFDDLERVAINESEALSYINEFVEHQGINSIVVCDESKIEDGKFPSYKEKVILYTYKINRSVDEIVDIAFSDIDDLAEDLVKTSKTELSGILGAIDCDNLRTLNLAVACYGKLIKALESTKHGNLLEEELVNLLYPCIAYAIGYREMYVDEEDLKGFTYNQANMGVRVALEDDGENKDYSKWKEFYKKVACKWGGSLESLAAYRLVCQGYLDLSALNSDIDKWKPSTDDPKNSIVNINYNFKDHEFEKISGHVIKSMKSRSLYLDNAQELIYLIRNLYTLVKEEAIDYHIDDIKELLTSFIEYILCSNSIEDMNIIWGSERSDDEFVKKLIVKVIDKSEDLEKKKEIKYLQNCLISAIKGENTSEAYRVLYGKTVRPFIEKDYAGDLVEALRLAEPINLIDINRYFYSRYEPQNVFHFLKDEIDGLKRLKCDLDRICSSKNPSLSKFLLNKILYNIQDVLENRLNY